MPVKRIFSAGGIVLRLRSGPSVLRFAQDVPSISGKWQVLVTQHSGHKGWDFPKGHIESGESSEAAALREVEEETGVKAAVIEKVGETQYFYWEGKEKVLKTVTYYLMRYKGQGEASTAFEVSDKIWLAPEDVKDKLTFKDTKELWEKVKKKIEGKD